MKIFFERLKELKGSQSTAAFAKSIGIPQQSMDRYLKGRVPTLEVMKQLCLVYSVSSDWLLGLPDHSTGSVATANGPGAIAAAGHASINAGQDCSKCKLMQAHLKEITGRP